MSPNDPEAAPKHRSFELTSERQLSTRQRIARAAIVIYFVTFLASALVMCVCPEFFAAMAACTVVSIVCGSRLQRLLSVGLLVVAIVGFVFQYRAEQQTIERGRRMQQLHEQRSPSQ